MSESIIKFVGDLEIEIQMNEETKKYNIVSPISKLLVEGNTPDEVFEKYVSLMKLTK